MTNPTTPRDIVDHVFSQFTILPSNLLTGIPATVRDAVIEALQRAGHLNEWRPLDSEAVDEIAKLTFMDDAAIREVWQTIVNAYQRQLGRPKPPGDGA